MSESVRPPALLPGDMPSRWQAWRRWLLKTFPGRALVLGIAIKAITWPLGFVLTLPGWLDAIDMVGSLALLFGVAYGLTRLGVWAKRRLLWRVRRKLILSYVFVGVVPALLVITFFLLAGLIIAFNISSYLVQSRVRNLTEQARFLAQTVQLEVQRSATADAIAEALERRQATTETRYPFTSLTIVPVQGLSCKVQGAAATRAPRQLPSTLPVVAGPWAHLPPPTALPKWVGCDGFAGLIAYKEPGSDRQDDSSDANRLVMRAVALPETPAPTWAVILDMPMSSTIEDRIHQETGIRIGEISAYVGSGVQPVLGRSIESRPDSVDDGPAFSLQQSRWVVFLPHVDWPTGEPESASVGIVITILEIYDRISNVSPNAIGGFNFGQILLFVLSVVGVLFLIIQFVALVIGFVLARQITGAVHDLFTGTQHVRAGNFGHQITVRARD